MSFSQNTGEELVTCPYNNVHQVRRKHLQHHLINCRVNYPESELKKCPFNSCHIVSELEYPIHISTCPDKVIISNYKYHINSKPGKILPVSDQPVIEDDEDWDDDEK